MSIDYDTLSQDSRLLMEARLTPLQGHRFQPTGFADLGPARYTLPDGTEMLIVESVQSVANRMELACWDSAADDLIDGLRGLPYIRVRRSGDGTLTNSVLESHRINSEYIASDKSFVKRFSDSAAYSKGEPIDWKKFHEALLKYDIGSLIHGAFLEEIDGRLRATRILSGFIEARDVRVAESGGAKASRVDPTVKGGGGNVLFHRTEFTAAEIRAYFNLDLALLRGYGLGDDATHLLIALSLLKVGRFLSTGLRLRTACDLELDDGGLAVTRPVGFVVPSQEELLRECGNLISRCRSFFADPAITEIEWRSAKSTRKAEGEKNEGTEEGGDENADEDEGE